MIKLRKTIIYNKMILNLKAETHLNKVTLMK